MDVLDYLDLDKAHKKYDRVRSWYLYEQFKSLEGNQQDAARRLKSKSCQDRILHQELNERRVRRRLCDQFDSCHSESHYDSCREAEYAKTACADDIFASFCELETDNDFFDSDIIYNNGQYSQSDKKHDFASDDFEQNTSRSKEVENKDSGIYNEELVNNIKQEQELELINTNIAESINLQLETVKENIEYLEQYTRLSDDGPRDPHQIYDRDSLDSCEQSLKEAKNKNNEYSVHFDNSILVMWSKVVTFAYQLIKLNHGANCYFDYSSQFLASVLVFDVLRRVVGRICNILQPYVSPIKFNPSEQDISTSSLYEKKKKYTLSMRTKNNVDKLIPPYRKKSSERDWQCNYENKQKELKFRSTPFRHVEKLSYKNLYEDYTIQESEEYSRVQFLCKCRCLKKVFNRMLQLSRLVDDILEEVAD